VTTDDAQAFAWAPDGSRIAFLHDPQGDGSKHLWTALPDGSGVLERSDLPSADRSVKTFSWSPDSTRLAYVADQEESDVDEPFLVGPVAGMPAPIDDLSGDLDATLVPVWSPDGGRVAFRVSDAPLNTGDVRVHDVAAGTTDVVIGGYGPGNGPGFLVRWSPDGDHLAVEMGFNNPFHVDLHVAAADGSSDVKVGPAQADQFVDDVRWSPDGQRLLYRLYRGSMGYDLFTVHRTGGPTWQLSNVPASMNQVSQVGDYGWLADGLRVVFSGGELGAPVSPAPTRLFLAYPYSPGVPAQDVTQDPTELAEVPALLPR
jgi:Tol biopolymer transport system component